MSARRPWAWPLVPLYAAGLAIKDSLRAGGVLKTQRLPWPVISVGSLSAGGAGKTPVVIALAGLLRNRGWHVDVLTRGYSREGSSAEQVQPESDNSASRFGDEPVLIARRTGVPVWVGADRFEAGSLAEAAHADQMRCVHLLDDGFQHRQLARTVDVALVTEDDLDDSRLPAGNLREPLKGIARANIIAVREDERDRIEPRLRPLMRDDTALWVVRRQLCFPRAAKAETPRYVAFCAIARPMDFLSGLRQANISVIDAVTFPDHHRYTMADIAKLIAKSDDFVSNAFVTTEKDAVKLSPAMREKLESHGPLIVARLEASFADEAAVVRDLEAKLQ